MHSMATKGGFNSSSLGPSPNPPVYYSSQTTDPHQAQTTVMFHQPSSSPISGSSYRYGQYPAVIVCQHCQSSVTTEINHKVGLLTWAIAGVMCLMCLIIGCCLIPFCINATKDVQHRCPNCKNVVGMFRHFS